MYVADRLERRRPPSRANETDRQPTSDTLTRAARAPHERGVVVGSVLVHRFIHRSGTGVIHSLIHRLGPHLRDKCEAPGMLPSAFPLRMAPDRGLRRPDVRRPQSAPSTLRRCSNNACAQGCGRGGDARECSCGQGGTALCMAAAARAAMPVRPAQMALALWTGKKSVDLGRSNGARTGLGTVHGCGQSRAGVASRRYGARVAAPRPLRAPLPAATTSRSGEAPAVVERCRPIARAIARSCCCRRGCHVPKSSAGSRSCSSGWPSRSCAVHGGRPAATPSLARAPPSCPGDTSAACPSRRACDGCPTRDRVGAPAPRSTARFGSQTGWRQCLVGRRLRARARTRASHRDRARPAVPQARRRLPESRARAGLPARRGRRRGLGGRARCARRRVRVRGRCRRRHMATTHCGRTRRRRCAAADTPPQTDAVTAYSALATTSTPLW